MSKIQVIDLAPPKKKKSKKQTLPSPVDLLSPVVEVSTKVLAATLMANTIALEIMSSIATELSNEDED